VRLVAVPSLIDVLVTCMAKASLMAYRALATPLCASIGLCEVFAVAYHVWSTGALVCLHRYSYVYPLVLPYLVATWLLFLLGWCDALIRRTFNLVSTISHGKTHVLMTSDGHRCSIAHLVALCIQGLHCEPLPLPCLSRWSDGMLPSPFFC
jgi:hypothetical protein